MTIIMKIITMMIMMIKMIITTMLKIMMTIMMVIMMKMMTKMIIITMLKIMMTITLKVEGIKLFRQILISRYVLTRETEDTQSLRLRSDDLTFLRLLRGSSSSLTASCKLERCSRDQHSLIECSPSAHQEQSSWTSAHVAPVTETH